MLLSFNTVSFHSFKSQKLKLSVSNPKSKHVAYLSLLSQISKCQGLGRKHKHEILKTDRIGFPGNAKNANNNNNNNTTNGNNTNTNISNAINSNSINDNMTTIMDRRRAP